MNNEPIFSALSGKGIGTFSLSGAGNSGYNGCYTEAGTHNGKPYYTLTGNGSTKYLAYSSSWNTGDGCAWYVANQLEVNEDFMSAYFNTNCTATPPTDNGWGFGPGPFDPAPTVTQGC